MDIWIQEIKLDLASPAEVSFAIRYFSFIMSTLWRCFAKFERTIRIVTQRDLGTSFPRETSLKQTHQLCVVF
jgi:hypothetical protein